MPNIKINALTTIVAATYDTSNDFAETVRINNVEFFFDNIKTVNIPVEKLLQSHLLQLTAKSDIHEARRVLHETHGEALGCKSNFAAFLQKELFISIVGLTPCNVNIMPQVSVTSDTGAVYGVKNAVSDTIQNQISLVLKTLKISAAPIAGRNSIIEALQVTNYYYKPTIGHTKNLLSDEAQLEISQKLEMGDVTILPNNKKGFVVIQVPNKQRRFLDFSISDIDSNKTIPILIGQDTDGEMQTICLTECPHKLIAGMTGAGKSVFLNTVISSIIATTDSDDVKLVLIDPKRAEFSSYRKLNNRLYEFEGLPKIITSVEDAETALKDLVDEMENRYIKLEDSDCVNIKELRKKGVDMPYIVCVIDEFGDLMINSKTKDTDAETSLILLAQKARAVGIHLIIATQRPDAKIVSTSIRAQFPTVACFSVKDSANSRIVLGSKGGETLTGKGDMLLSFNNTTKRIQSPMIDKREVLNIIQKDNLKSVKQTSLFN